MLGKYLIGASLALSAITAAGWYVTKGHLDTVRADLKTAQAITRATVAARTEEQRAAREAADVAATNYARVRELQNEIEDLRAAHAAGNVELRVEAHCPSVSNTSGAGGVDNGTRCRLTEDAERNYFALRDQIAVISGQLKACQDHIRVMLGVRAQ